MLPHEHVLVDFVGVEQVSRDRYDRKEVYQTVLPYLEEAAASGCRSLAECTPQYLGRDAVLLQQLSRATGVRILTNTGYYGARDDQHVPQHAYADSIDELAARWVEEWRDGIGDTGIRPGFIKIGVDGGRLSEIDEKLVRASCRAHLQTGLAVAVHTGPAVGAFHQLEVLEDEGVAPRAWIWVHAQSEDDLSRHVAAADRGAWVEFDGFSRDQVDRYVEMVSNMRAHDRLDRVLISQDNGWYDVGGAQGSEFQPYDPLFTDFLPALQKAGFSEEEIRQLTVVNPREAFTIRVREA